MAGRRFRGPLNAAARGAALPGGMATDWTVVVLTCQHRDSAFAFQRGEGGRDDGPAEPRGFGRGSSGRGPGGQLGPRLPRTWPGASRAGHVGGGAGPSRVVQRPRRFSFPQPRSEELSAAPLKGARGAVWEGRWLRREEGAGRKGQGRGHRRRSGPSPGSRRSSLRGPLGGDPRQARERALPPAGSSLVALKEDEWVSSGGAEPILEGGGSDSCLLLCLGLWLVPAKGNQSSARKRMLGLVQPGCPVSTPCPKRLLVLAKSAGHPLPLPPLCLPPELEIRRDRGSLGRETILLTVEDPKAQVGSGGATLNALLVAAEHLSAQAGYTVSPPTSPPLPPARLPLSSCYSA